jgi:2-polyprenyl-3-methyl-5-hydroxy-6-metoxy-1,4-benzoquinol methylase
MPDITWTNQAMPIVLSMIPKETKTLVDVGCGRGLIGALCRLYRDNTRLVGIDIYEPYLNFCKHHKLYDELFQWDLERAPLPFKDKEFEVTTCIEVIEHLPMCYSQRLVNELERIAYRVIISTPNYFYEQKEFDLNPYQKHKALWTVRDFRRLNYNVRGFGSMKIFGKKIRYISTMLGPLTKVIPGASDALICSKINSVD